MLVVSQGVEATGLNDSRVCFGLPCVRGMDVVCFANHKEPVLIARFSFIIIRDVVCLVIACC